MLESKFHCLCVESWSLQVCYFLFVEWYNTFKWDMYVISLKKFHSHVILFMRFHFIHEILFNLLHSKKIIWGLFIIFFWDSQKPKSVWYTCWISVIFRFCAGSASGWPGSPQQSSESLSGKLKPHLYFLLRGNWKAEQLIPGTLP